MKIFKYKKLLKEKKELEELAESGLEDAGSFSRLMEIYDELSGKKQNIFLFLALMTILPIIIFFAPPQEKNLGAGDKVVFFADGRNIELAYTDDNTDEDLVILTDKKVYDNGLSHADVYFTVLSDKSISADVDFKFQGSENVESIKELKKKTVLDYLPIYEDLKCTPEPENDCQPKKIGTTTRERIVQEWVDIDLGDETLLLGADKKNTDYYTTSKFKKNSPKVKKSQKIRVDIPKTKTKLLGGKIEYKLFKALITYPKETQSEFFIEVIGEDGSYGHLDPTFGNDGGGTWTRYCPLVIQSSVIPSDQSNFPVLLTEDTLCSEMFDADGSYPALNGGADIRFTSDSAGTSELPFEVVSFVTDNDPGNGTAEIWVKTGIDGDTDTTIYAWYNNSSATAYAVSDTYGRNNVWSSYKAVWHLEQNPTGTTIDSTGNFDGSNGGGLASGDLVDAKIKKGINFDGASNEYLNVGNLIVSSPVSFVYWGKPDSYSPSNEATIYGNRDGTDVNIVIGQEDNSPYSGAPRFYYYSGGWHIWKADSNPLSGTFSYQGWTYSGSADPIFYNNGSSYTSTQYVGTGHSALQSNAVNSYIGAHAAGASEQYVGWLDELRIIETELSSDWISAGYANQNSPATFVVEGTPDTSGGTPPATPAPVRQSEFFFN